MFILNFVLIISLYCKKDDMTNKLIDIIMTH